ncbi:glycosyltransferase WbuB [Flavobacterium bomense]|uniref:Glycosyltransferase WbuB n=1 Tax=Flavobacterium bomense TaxID=2497483 RepID=A0A432CN67_9FLAO|nr:MULTISPECIES: glycosyltransferase family 4 protein [Flavobacterium]RTY66255.1 glycosyltransferase WbuB [Flavobacterium sp. LB2P53]RTZ05517.1 glycosyltransferase WbuB [Flavobacterium bomense]
MNILFLTLVKIKSLEERGIYTDLLRKFKEEGHNVFVVSPSERRDKKKTHLSTKDGVSILNVRTFNLQKTNIVEKGIGTLAIEYQYLNAIKKYFSTIKFDLILYSTPPITFSKVIDFVKKRDNAYSYLLLKDIFPQNAVDMKMLKEGGALHKFFLKKERRLYELSDTIGCMSEANKKYIIDHNPTIIQEKVEVNPNSIAPIETVQTAEEKRKIRKKYGLPFSRKIIVYGGNLGKPQGLDFLLETIISTINPNVFFLIVGSGTEFNRIYKWFQNKRPKNAMLVSGLPKQDYDKLLKVCDVGMIFLHQDFKIPNFPSRLLSYLEMKMPVITATDSNTDIGSIIKKNNCGYSVLSGDSESMQSAINKIVSNDEAFYKMQENAWNLLQREYTVTHSYQLIKNKIENV